MTNQEINEAVARKLGIKQRIITNKRLERVYLKDGNYHKVKDYSTSIAAAWEIMEKERYALFSRFPVNDKSVKQAWVCDADGVLYSADTAPLAICLAFLKLKE